MCTGFTPHNLTAQPCPPDTLAERLRRRPAKPMGSPRVGSNPTGAAYASSLRIVSVCARATWVPSTDRPEIVQLASGATRLPALTQPYVPCGRPVPRFFYASGGRARIAVAGTLPQRGAGSSFPPLTRWPSGLGVGLLSRWGLPAWVRIPQASILHRACFLGGRSLGAALQHVCEQK